MASYSSTITLRRAIIRPNDSDEMTAHTIMDAPAGLAVGSRHCGGRDPILSPNTHFWVWEKGWMVIYQTVLFFPWLQVLCSFHQNAFRCALASDKKLFSIGPPAINSSFVNLTTYSLLRLGHRAAVIGSQRCSAVVFQDAVFLPLATFDLRLQFPFADATFRCFFYHSFRIFNTAHLGTLNILVVPLTDASVTEARTVFLFPAVALKTPTSKCWMLDLF